ncbi:MAG: Gldg family protein [Alphaproteobacteria bacterium]|nr:Gldg family protein [Alphaproteobacteria bacterium]
MANSLLRNIQFDATEEKLYTLSPSTQKVLEDLPDNVLIKFYYSPMLGEKNYEMRLMFDRIRILLNKYVAASNGKIDYKIYAPKFLDRIEDEAITNKIQPIPMIELNQNGFFGMTFSDALDNKKSIPFFPMERQNFIEQDITQKIYELYHQKKTVGILTPLVIGDSKISENVITTRWEIVNVIEELYDIKFISKPEEIDNLDVLMIIHPQKLDNEIIESIKAYSRKGGKFFVAADGAVESSRLYTVANQEFAPSNMNGLDEFWGVKLYNNWVVADMDNSIAVDATDNYKSNPKFSQDLIQLKYDNKAFNPHLPEIANLQSIMFTSVSPIVPTGKDIIFIPMIKASDNSQIMPIKTIYDNLAPNEILKLFKPDENTKILAARVLGETIENPFELVIVGDTDFLYDSFWSKSTQILDEQYAIPLLDNANFVMNVLDTLTQDTNLVELRGRAAKFRKFEDVEKSRREAQHEFALKEASILEKIDRTKKDLEEITNKRNFEKRDEFTTDELAVLANIRQNFEALRQELSDIRLNNNLRVKKIETDLKLFNIFAVPTLILLALLIGKKRQKGKTEKPSQKLSFNKEFKIVMGASLALLIVGTLATFLTDRSEIDSYEDKAVFENLAQEVNSLEKIAIKRHESELVFYKENNIWKLQGYEDFPVYQERIKSLLISLINARYYEKKTSKMEHLDKFGLTPIEEPNSKNTRIELLAENGKIISAFEIGKLDIDIGRGAKAAYMKFDNQFQVWLIAVDFIDLSSNWQDWTYSTAWNLRFGRLQNFDNKSTNESLLFARDLVNVHFTGKTLPKGTELSSIELITEDDDKIELELFKNGTDYAVSYKQVSQRLTNQHLQFFYETVKGKKYQISAEDKDTILNDINNLR